MLVCLHSLSTIGVVFTICFTYTGFVLLAVATMWSPPHTCQAHLFLSLLAPHLCNPPSPFTPLIPTWHSSMRRNANITEKIKKFRKAWKEIREKK